MCLASILAVPMAIIIAKSLPCWQFSLLHVHHKYGVASVVRKTAFVEWVIWWGTGWIRNHNAVRGSEHRWTQVGYSRSAESWRRWKVSLHESQLITYLTIRAEHTSIYHLPEVSLLVQRNFSHAPCKNRNTFSQYPQGYLNNNFKSRTLKVIHYNHWRKIHARVCVACTY